MTQSLVVGGGIVGASIAWRLARLGIRVQLMEASRFGEEASHAGAGMLAPGGEATAEHEWAGLAVESLAMYPGYVQELVAASGRTIDFRKCGAVELAMTGQEWQALLERAESQRELGIQSEELPLAEAKARIPGLALDGVKGAMWFPGEAVVEPRDVMAALREACLRSGVEIREGCRVSEVDAHARGVEVRTSDCLVHARTAVIAAGAWSGGIAVRAGGEPVETPRSFPVRGHLAAFHSAPGTLGPILRHHGTYLLQRNNGRLLIGTSEEEVGFDRQVNPDTVRAICARASALLPELASRVPDECWIGFRPATVSRDPEIRRLGATPVWLAYGHYRNGILLAPVTARLLAGAIANASG